MSYLRFFAMVGTATLLMYAMTYLNSWEAGHVRFSQTRLWMALLMGAMMAAVMLAFMGNMYRDRTANLVVFAGAAVVFAASLWLVRSQQTVGDVAWMKAMIPHHSIAILTSERAQIEDPRVRDLARRIIEAQRAEIAEMEALIGDLGGAGRPGLTQR
jgi:uncharacterized protein (DUF305 family)